LKCNIIVIYAAASLSQASINTFVHIQFRKSREAQKQLVAEVTQIVSRIARDPGRAHSGTAFGREEFAALAAKKT
jgi:hypothetical protein